MSPPSPRHSGESRNPEKAKHAISLPFLRQQKGDAEPKRPTKERRGVTPPNTPSTPSNPGSGIPRIMVPNRNRNYYHRRQT